MYFFFSGRKKQLFSFSPLTNNYTVKKGIIKLFPARERMVNDIPAGEGKINNSFYSVLRETVFLNEFGFFQKEVSGKKGCKL
jgi:hypothetical protein